MTARSKNVSIEELIEQFQTFLIDSYGVLLTSSGAIAGAAAFIERLEQSNREYRILTNDAGKLPETTAQKYQQLGINIPLERVITSGMLLADYFRDRELLGATAVVLGTPDSAEYARRAGAEVLPLAVNSEAEVCVIADDGKGLIHESLSVCISLLFRLLDGGRVPHLVLCNPDLIYPAGPQLFHVAAGSFAYLLDTVLQMRYPEMQLECVPLGKPHAPMFERGLAGSAKETAVMIGDTLQTDVKGANEIGIASVLLGTGVSRDDVSKAEQALVPDFLLASLC